MRYDTLLLDADNTLFDFDAAERGAFSALAEAFSLPDDDECYALYHRINHALWKEFEQGLVTKTELTVERFRRLTGQLGRSDERAADMHVCYAAALGRQAILYPGVPELCRRLSGLCRLYMVTNGNRATQRSRFERAGILPWFQDVFISDDIGHPKPTAEYFAYVTAHIPDFHPERTLMVGDSLSSDIRGGQNAHLDTCWFNPDDVPCTLDEPPTFTIRSLDELFTIIQ